MGKIILLLPVILLCITCGASAGVPPLSMSEFSNIPAAAVSAINEVSAHPLWLILAGEGFWGAIVIGGLGFVYRLARPYIIAWLEERKLARLFLAIEAFAAKTNADYTEGMKKANADGKLTKDEAEFVFRQCKQNLIIFMRTQGVDIIKEYGDEFVDGLIELIVSRLPNPLAKVVAVPLSKPSDSAPLPPSVTEGARPA